MKTLDSSLRWLLSTGPGNLTLLLVIISWIIFPTIFIDLRNDNLTIHSFKHGLMAVSIVSAFMYMQFGSPRNWWVPFFGITLSVNTDRFSNSADDTQLKKDVADWVEKMSRNRYIKINDFKFKFLRKRDAIAFKLAWM